VQVSNRFPSRNELTTLQGFGHTVNYLDKAKTTRYIALEPNKLMHPQIRALANAAGYSEEDGTLVILACGAADVRYIQEALGGAYVVDTIISILTLCTIPAPQRTLQSLVGEVLKPGGQILFYEHVLNPRPDVAWWQHFWAPVWSLFLDGCRIDRPSHVWVDILTVPNAQGKQVSPWSSREVYGKPGEVEEGNMFWHRAGKYVKSV
jgi:hypothetical protein